LQLEVENAIAQQQATKQAWSNATATLNGGWPSYEFGDGSNGFSGILRRQNGEPSVKVSSRSIADTPNCFTVDFQDGLNGYQQDSYSVVEPNDVALAGRQVTTTLLAAGLPNCDQAARILKFNLDKSVQGNTYIEFETSVRGFGIRPGDLITVTYLKEGFARQPFRVLKLLPATNYRTTIITAQIHDDCWYADSNGQATSGAGGVQQGPSGVGVPRPLLGSILDDNGNIEFGIVESDGSDTNGDRTVSVAFLVPPVNLSAGPGVPLIGLTAVVGTGGSLKGGQVLYYAVASLDSAGNESGLSFTVRASTTADGVSVTLSGLSFAPGSSGFNVYRGNTPAEFYRIASNQAIASCFTDTGLAVQLIAPPDCNFDHANFYWRMEIQPEAASTIHSATTIGNAGLEMDANAYRGMTARITRGTGAGQEAATTVNTGTTLTVAQSWAIEPDATSFFVVAESGWHFGALAKSSPVEFDIPDRGGEVVHITGRSANVNDMESAPELSIVTRWQIEGSATGDTDVPATPLFGLTANGSGGSVLLSGISFCDLKNTKTISSANLTLHYWDEVNGSSPQGLAQALGTTDTTLNLVSPGPATAGDTIQIDAEVLQVTAVADGGIQYRVTRGMDGSSAVAHASEAAVYQLVAKTVITSFPESFFGSPYSGAWNYPILLPDVRIASAELFVTNQKGDSPLSAICLTHTVDSGLRTLSGGQYSIEVSGYLAVDQSAAPAVIVDATRSVRDAYAVLGTAADAAVMLQLNVNGSVYCTLTFPPGAIVSNAANGNKLPALVAGEQLTLSVLSVGQTYPGADLTVIIRL
jgi:hypothetical protein